MAADSEFCGSAHIRGGDTSPTFHVLVLWTCLARRPQRREWGLTGAFFLQNRLSRRRLTPHCRYVPVCRPSSRTLEVGFQSLWMQTWMTALVILRVRLHLRLRRLACILDWPYASSLCTSGEPAPMQLPLPKMFNVDLSLALPLTVSDLRGVALRASRSAALPSVCHGFLQPSRARQGEEVELDCVSWQGPNRVARPAVSLLRPIWSGSLRMPLHDCGMNCSLWQADCGGKL